MRPGVNRFWASAAIVLFATTVIGAVVAWSRYSHSAAVEITLDQPLQWDGLISVNGAVVAPGIYPFESTDTIDALLQAAGGLKEDASLGEVILSVAPRAVGREGQRVDINRADTWLLQALPGVGETLADRIVHYREQSGDFASTSELKKVSGIGEGLFERIKDLITVSD